MKLSIVIFAHSDVDFKAAKTRLKEVGVTQERIYFCDSKESTRLNFLKKQSDEWFLFLDSDCQISKETVQGLVQGGRDSQIVLAGLYINPKPSSYLQRAHNFVANTWLQSSYKSGRERYILGGAFLIYSDQGKLKNVIEPKELFWGAEDKLLSQLLFSAGYELKLDPNFEVTHNTSKTINHFLRRAWLQGYNDDLSQGKDVKEKSKINYWLSELVKTSLWLAPAVLVHFSVLQSGKWFQKARPKRSKKLLE